MVALLNALMVDASSAFRFRCSKGDDDYSGD